MPFFRLLTGFFLCAAILLGASVASAQKQDSPPEEPGFFYQYDKKYRPSIHDKKEKGLSVLSRGLVLFTLLRGENDGPGDFTIRVSSPVSVSGCADIQNPEILVRKSSPALIFTIKEPRATAEKSMATRYPHYQCDTGLNFAYTDIPLNRDDLIKEGIKKITMKSASGPVFEDLEIEADENKVVVRGPRGEATRWFYPPGTIILYAPALGPGHDLADDLVKKARARGLVPMEEILKGFENPEHLKNGGAYFMDHAGVLHREIKVAGKPVFFGKTQIEEIYFGPGGKYKKPVKIDLYARTPGEFE